MIHRRKALLFGIVRVSLLVVYSLFLTVQVFLRYTSDGALDTDSCEVTGKAFQGDFPHKLLTQSSWPEEKHILNKRYQPVDSPGMPPQESGFEPLFTFVRLVRMDPDRSWSCGCPLVFRLRGPPFYMIG